MWSRFKKRFFGGSRKMADDASSLDETIVHACVLTEAEDIHKSRQTLQQFAKDDLHAVPTELTPADKKGNCTGGGGGGSKLRRKLSWFGAKSRRTTKSMTSLNSDKRRSGDDAVLATKTTTTSTAPEPGKAVQTSTVQQAAEPRAAATSTESSATDKPSSDGAVSGDQPTGVVDSVVRITSSKTSSSLLNVDKSLLVSRDDVWCSRVEFTADKGTFGATCTSHIEELQRPASLPVYTAADVKSSPPKLKRRAKATSQIETETRKSRLSKNLSERDPPPSAGERPAKGHNPSPATTTTSTTETSLVSAASTVDATDTTEHLKSNAVHGPSTSSASGKRVPPPVPIRKYPPSSTASSVSAEHRSEALSIKTGSSSLAAATTVVEEGQVSPSPTRNSPDSGSDDTEGKESGYVTLDDLQAQLMRSSWSSDERDVTDSRSSTAHAASLTDALSCENQSTTTTSSTISELPITPPGDAQMTVVQTSDEETWPPPPPPINEAHTATTPVSSGGELPETPGSSSPVVRFTFTVKLDSQLLKRRRQLLDGEQDVSAAAPLTVDDVAPVDDDQTPCASPPETRPPSSKSRPEMAVVIPDVVVCADAIDSKKHGVGSTFVGDQQQRCVHVVPSPMDGVVRRHQGCTASRSSQTDVGDVLAAQPQTCTCFCAKNYRTPAADKPDDVDSSGRLDSDDADQLSCRCSSVLDDVTVDDDDDDLWAQPEMDRTGVRVDDGSYLRPLVTRVYPADKSDMTTRGRPLPQGELTHMSWSEVLKEAQTMGIPLHLRTTSATAELQQRQPSSAATSTSTTPVKKHPSNDEQRRRTTKPASEGGGNKKIPSSGTKTSFRDLFRLPQLFGRKKSSSNNNNRVRRSKSMEPHQRIQARCLPTPPNNRLHQRHQCDLSAGTDTDRTRHWVCRSSRYSASSCPPAASTQCSRSRSSSSRHAVDYYPGSSWAASSCSGSLPPYRHRCTAGFDVMDEMVVAVDDVVCVSPSMSSFSSVCSASRTAPWRTHRPVPTTPNSVTSSSLASPGIWSSMSKSSWQNSPTDFVNCLSELHNCGWYWGAMSFDEAEAMLANRRDGSFLVRDSSDERYILSLSFRSLGGTHHTRIEHYKGTFSFCSQSLASSGGNESPATTIVDFIDNAMATSRSGRCLYYLLPRSPGLVPTPVRILHPVSRFRCMHSLQHLCKFAVLRHVRLDLVDRLPIPPRLKEYIKHGRATAANPT